MCHQTTFLDARPISPSSKSELYISTSISYTLIGDPRSRCEHMQEVQKKKRPAMQFPFVSGCKCITSPPVSQVIRAMVRSDHLLPVWCNNELSHYLPHAHGLSFRRSTTRRSLLDHIDHYASRQEPCIHPTSDK